VTVAPAIAAPFASVTKPEMLPLMVWAVAEGKNKKPHTNTVSVKSRGVLLMRSSLNCFWAEPVDGIASSAAEGSKSASKQSENSKDHAV